MPTISRVAGMDGRTCRGTCLAMRNGVESIQQVGNSKTSKRKANCTNALRFILKDDFAGAKAFATIVRRMWQQLSHVLHLHGLFLFATARQIDFERGIAVEQELRLHLSRMGCRDPLPCRQVKVASRCEPGVNPIDQLTYQSVGLCEGKKGIGATGRAKQARAFPRMPSRPRFGLRWNRGGRQSQVAVS